MPFRARLAEGGVVDATQHDPGTGDIWSRIHRVRPRPMLRCEACGERMHAKVSPAPNRLRFFAHDVANTDCPWHGQSIEHYLLKAELAASIRAAGWVAQLEATGPGWRADVLAISPNGDSRIAWEAQLSDIATADVLARTEAMQRAGVAVCWVCDWFVRPGWFGHVPSVRINGRSHRDLAPRMLAVTDGLARFDPQWCTVREHCAQQPGLLPAGHALPCPGHGAWDEDVKAVPLDQWVQLVCSGQVQPHRPQLTLPARSRHGPLIWTAPRYREAEQHQISAEQERATAEQHTQALLAERRLADLNRIERRFALIRPTENFIAKQIGNFPEIPEWRGPGPRYAGGIPVFLDGRLVAVIMPDPDQLVRIRSWSAWFIVATDDEHDQLTAAGAAHRRIVVLAVE